MRMRLLKRDAATAIPWTGMDLRAEAAGSVERDLAEAERRASDLLALARREADRLRAEARTRGFAEGHEEGLVEGIARGERIGLERAVAEHAALAGRWTDALAAFDRDRGALLAAGRDGVLRLAMAIAGRIARRTLAVDPAAVAVELEAALETLGACDLATVEVPLGEKARLERALPPLAAALAAAGGLTIVEREDLAAGGVIVRTADGRVDASLEARIERVAEAILASAGEVRTGEGTLP
jgi:flagellar assembly protein FliH